MSQGFTTPLPIPLPVNQGGTGVVTSTGTGNTVLSNSPTLVTPNIGNTTLATNATVSRTVTFPDATGTVALTTGIPTAATQSDQETATSTTTYVSPGTQQYHPSAAKMWCYATYSGSTPVNNASYNQSSITDSNTGLMTHNFTVAFSSTSYVPLVTRPDPSNLAYTPSALSLAAGSVQSYTVQDNGTPGDLGRVICCFGDQ